MQECLIVSKGRIKVTLYDDGKKMFKNLYLRAGEAIIFLSGGHKVEVKEDAEMYEIKNGPFIDDLLIGFRFNFRAIRSASIVKAC